MRYFITILLILFNGYGCVALSQTEEPEDRPIANTTRYRANLHAELALAYLEKKQPHAARFEAEQALALTPTSSNALHVMALTDLALEDTNAAHAHFQKALHGQGGMDNIALLLNYSTFLCDEQQQQVEEGRALLHRAVQIAPTEAGHIEELFEKCQKQKVS